MVATQVYYFIIHKTVILPQIMVAHAFAHQAFCTKIARSAKTARCTHVHSCMCACAVLSTRACVCV